jgi:hypothetical protein
MNTVLAGYGPVKKYGFTTALAGVDVDVRECDSPALTRTQPALEPAPDPTVTLRPGPVPQPRPVPFRPVHSATAPDPP